MQTLSAYQSHDHARCDALLRQAHLAVGAGCWDDARRAMRAFQHTLERHMLIEEQIIFPAFDLALGHAESPTLGMCAEHLRIRAAAGRLADAVAAGNSDAFVKHAETLLLTLHMHSEKEDGVLYPMIDRLLTGRGPELLAAVHAFSAQEAGTGR